MTPVYDVHGIRMRSEIPLTAVETDPPADLEVRWGDPEPVPDDPPPGEILAAAGNDTVAHTVSRDRDTLRMRMHRTCEFRLRDGVLTVHMDPAADPALAAVMLTGNVPAVLLTVAGEPPLHATAVAFEEGALVLAGYSGSGKSTLAAVLCAAGGRMVTEDLLRLRFEDGRPWALPGPPEIRLRPQASDVAPGPARPLTPDGRISLRPEAAGPAPVAGVVLPRPSREIAEMLVRPLSPAEGVIELLRFPRIDGWRSPDVGRVRLRTLAALVRAVPVSEVTIPWGPPFPRMLAEDLRRAATG